MHLSWPCCLRSCGRNGRRAQAAGWLALLGLALLSPLDALAAVLFSVHMVQHVLLMMAAAPLLALGAPVYIWLWALPLGGRRRVARWWHKQAIPRRSLRLLPLPWVAWLLSALAQWEQPRGVAKEIENELL